MSSTSDLRIRINHNQKEQLRNLAEGLGFRTISDYVRSRIFEDFSIHNKLNEVLVLLKKNNEV